jgi:hypothetical protein
VIKRDGAHLGALSNLGTLLFNAGYRTAARLTYAEALKHHPDDVQTLVNLGNLLLDASAYDDARKLYDRAVVLEPQCAAAHQGLSHVFERLGDERAAGEHRRIGFSLRPVTLNAFRGEGMPCSLLVLASPMRGNVPLNEALDDRTFLTVSLFVDYYDPALPLPPHDVIFNGIGDADLCGESLEAARALLRAHGASAINDPARVRETGRAAMAERLRGIDGLVVPNVRECSREQLTAIDAFPVLVRPPGYHTGEFFERVESREELARIAASLPGERILAIEPLDARGADGIYRKCRLLSIGGRFFPIHLARSSQWKVHYFSADQARTPEGIAEEERFLADPAGAIGAGGWRALQAAAARIGLDYFGIDFALGSGGEVLFFEANATMRAVVPLADGTNEARRRAALTANEALKALVLARASG